MSYIVSGSLFNLTVGFLMLYLIYFLLTSTLNIISNLFSSENKNEKDKDI
ncbi:TPA: hypothetical protein ACI4AV_003786 [Proteus mirabilis]